MNKVGGLIFALLTALVAAWAWSAKPSSSLQAQAALEAMPASQGNFARITGPRPLDFPEDFGAHPDTQTEWWYFTGNLRSSDGRRFGFQLTFFRRGLVGPDLRVERGSAWGTDQVYLAHFALADAGRNAFRAFERIERGGEIGLAGAVGSPGFEVWLRDWSVKQTADGLYRLSASHDGIVMDLTLADQKGPVLQGVNGYSQKGPEAGNASTYVSLTRLEAIGVVKVDGMPFTVDGSAWMDHEYGTSALGAGQVGWDWFSVQLKDGRDLMLYTIRRADGTLDEFSRGLLVEADGSKRPLLASDFRIQIMKEWKSPHSGGVYPAEWMIQIPSVDLELQITPLIADQELNNSFVYWEGAVQVVARQAGLIIDGWGYTELTGYARSFEGGF